MKRKISDKGKNNGENKVVEGNANKRDKGNGKGKSIVEEDGLRK